VHRHKPYHLSISWDIQTTRLLRRNQALPELRVREPGARSSPNQSCFEKESRKRARLRSETELRRAKSPAWTILELLGDILEALSGFADVAPIRTSVWNRISVNEAHRRSEAELWRAKSGEKIRTSDLYVPNVSALAGLCTPRNSLRIAKISNSQNYATVFLSTIFASRPHTAKGGRKNKEDQIRHR